MSADELQSRVQTVTQDTIRRIDALDNRIIVLALLLPLLVFPAVSPSNYYLQVLIRVFVFMALVTTWNVIGYTGYINFGQAAFYGVGAYTMGFLLANYGLPMPLGAVVGAILAGLVGLGLGIVTLRLRGHYFSIASLMLLFILTTFVRNISEILPGARMEIWLSAWDVSAFVFNAIFYYVFLAFAVGYTLFAIWLERTRYGYGMKAISEDEDIALSLGVPTMKLKLVSLTVSALMAGLVGAFHGQFILYIDAPEYFSVVLTFLIVFMGFIGGFGVWYGPLIGALLFIPADEMLTYYVAPEMGRIIFGTLFVVIILLQPRGIGPWLEAGIRDLRAEKSPRPSGDDVEPDD